MPRPIKNLTNMEIDEISLVDKGANQHAMITIAKRAPEEEAMPELYNENGELLGEDTLLNEGDIVYDAEGQAYEFTTEENDEETPAGEELASVGKSAFFEQPKPQAQGGFTQSVLEELSKAFSDEDRDKVIAKALGRVEELEKQQRDFEQIAKAERDLRLTREYVAKAADYNLPVDPQELGPVLYRMAESMSYDDCAVIAKCLETAGTMLFQEAGFQGGGENADVFSMVENYAMEEVGKSAGSDMSKAAAVSKAFDENPEAYDEYLASKRGY